MKLTRLLLEVPTLLLKDIEVVGNPQFYFTMSLKFEKILIPLNKRANMASHYYTCKFHVVAQHSNASHSECRVATWLLLYIQICVQLQVAKIMTLQKF